MRKNKIKILAIDPGTKHMGFAAFEGTELVDYGVKTIRQGSEVIILRHLEEIISRLIKEKKPDYFVLERNSFSQIKQNYRLTLAISKMKYIAKKFGVLVYEYDPRTIRKEICKRVRPQDNPQGNLQRRKCQQNPSRPDDCDLVR